MQSLPTSNVDPDCFILWLVITLVWVNTLSFISRGSRKQLPPGPRPYPVIRNLLELGEKPHKSLAELAKIHGPIMSLKLASMAKSILLDHDSSFCNRTVTLAMSSHQHYEFSLAWMPVSRPWKSLRKICNMHIFTNREIAGFIVLKCAKVLVNVWATVKYESILDNAHNFTPERLLGSDIDFKGKNFELIPFGAGWQIYPVINYFDWKLEDKNIDMKKKEKRIGLII
ncbi:hypothetical protein CUMW_247270 [Citrus unshiu]|uniref:Cytochrome P450 n=1 Tax=Citrus unshiu TaxID=55188 RepID=A0A2H5QNS8_CITUN|nr:hypothetical protein CUMW_247270 [Citrus unshiu]